MFITILRAKVPVYLHLTLFMTKSKLHSFFFKKTIMFINVYFCRRSFKKTIAQGGKECCPYDNADCNPGLDRRSPIDLNVRIIYFLYNEKYILRAPWYNRLCLLSSRIQHRLKEDIRSTVKEEQALQLRVLLWTTLLLFVIEQTDSLGMHPCCITFAPKRICFQPIYIAP